MEAVLVSVEVRYTFTLTSEQGSNDPPLDFGPKMVKAVLDDVEEGGRAGDLDAVVAGVKLHRS